jgi:hypothetical protein
MKHEIDLQPFWNSDRIESDGNRIDEFQMRVEAWAEFKVEELGGEWEWIHEDGWGGYNRGTVVGIKFKDEADATAFKLKFGI